MRVLLFLLLLPSNFLVAQWDSQWNNFEESNHLNVSIADGAEDVWEIGPPDKILFDGAHSPPNAIVTKLEEAYPANSNASFELSIELTHELFGTLELPYLQFQWIQKVDVEAGGDGGTIEASYDEGLTWHNVFDSPIFRPVILGNYETAELLNGHQGFNGNLGWEEVRLVWQSYIGELPTGVESVKLRFIFLSDSNQTFQEGWMIDDFTIPSMEVSPGIEGIDRNRLNLFPNPVVNELVIENARNDFGSGILEIFDLFGRRVLYQEISSTASQSFPINVVHLSPGKYLAVLTNSERQLRQSFLKY